MAAVSFFLPFLCAWAVQVWSGPSCQAGEIGYKLSGAFTSTSSIPVPFQFTNHFRAEFGKNTYLFELFDQQSNLISQARCDGHDVSYWWRAFDSNALSTALISSLTNPAAEGVVRSFEDRIVGPLLWTAPGISSQLVDLLRRADPNFNLDYFPLITSNEFPQGVHSADVFDSDHRLVQRQFVNLRTVDFGGGNTQVITNTPYRVAFSNYARIGDISVPLDFTIEDLRLTPGFIDTYSIKIDHADFGGLSGLPAYFLDGLPRTNVIAVMDDRSGHRLVYNGDNLVKDDDMAPDFTASTFDGKTIKLSDYRGKVVLLDFWATWCGPCVAELNNFASVYNAYGNNPHFALIGLSLDTDGVAAAKLVRAMRLPWTQVLLGDISTSPVTRAYGLSGIPRMYLIGPDGRVIARDLRGPAIEKAVAGALARLGGFDPQLNFFHRASG